MGQKSRYPLTVFSAQCHTRLPSRCLLGWGLVSRPRVLPRTQMVVDRVHAAKFMVAFFFKVIW